MAGLLDELDGVSRGEGRLILLAGGPGIGKSRLADELARRAGEQGVTVLWGRCWEAGGAPAYWPWVQSIRSYLRGLDHDTIRQQMGPGAADIAQMMPEVRDVFPELPDRPTLDPDTARFRLFDATATFIRAAAAANPIVLILDDLHAADAPSLLLLRFLATEVGRTRLLIVGIYRDMAIDPGHPLSSTIAELDREPATRRLTLSGLAEADVAEYILLSTGSRSPASVVGAVWEETDGNPLFVGEVVRLLASERRLERATVSWRVSLPESIREVIGRRLEHLSPSCRDVLVLASVLGREFSLETLRRVGDAPTSELLEVLSEASDARVITDVPGAPGRLRFQHGLIRDALYDELSLPQRLQLHGRAGEALERIYAGDPEPHLAELAHHFFEAASGATADRAIEYARRAGDRAAALLAYEESARLYEMALQVLELQESTDRDMECDLLVALGEAKAKAGDGQGARETFLRAAEIAGRLGMPHRLGDAALGYGGRFVWARAAGDPNVRRLLEDALAVLGDEESELRVRVMARLAGVLRDERQREPRWSLSRQAVEMGRRIGDAATLAYALEARFAAIWEPETLPERSEIAAEMRRVADRSRDRERTLQGLGYRVHVLIEHGDMQGAEAALEEELALAAELQQPAWRWLAAVGRGAVALFRGRFGEAEELIPAALSIGQPVQAMDAQVSFRLQMYMLRREQGRAAELEADIRDAVREFHWYPMFRAALADLCVRTGRRAEARHILQELGRDEFAAFPRDSQWLFSISLLPEVAAFLGDRDAGAVLHRLLEPWSARNIYGVPEVIGGSAARATAIAAATAGRLDAASELFERALVHNGAMGSPPWIAHTQHDYARVLMARNGPGDRDRAGDLLGDALGTARERGLAALISAVSEDLGGLEEADRRTTTEVGGAAAEPEFRREGDVWLIAFEGRAVRLKDAKGLRYIHRLLAEPGREFHVAELASEPGVERHDSSSASAAGLDLDTGHAGDILDDRAKAEYGRRIEDLREEVDEATRWGDLERAARARQELEFISHELAAAYGLGGRARKGADTSERIRKAVSNRIRDAQTRIAKEHPALGRHLANAISTGSFCSYAPDRPIRWRE